MKEHYQKPVSRLLTQNIANGACATGDEVGSNCTPGSNYFDSSCIVGGFYFTPGCSRGARAGNCNNGMVANP